MAPAAVQGRKRGRPVGTTAAQRASIIERHRAGASISALARAERISRASVMRIVRPDPTSCLASMVCADTGAGAG